MQAALTSLFAASLAIIMRCNQHTALQPPNAEKQEIHMNKRM
jgi:hypothetical protein